MKNVHLKLNGILFNHLQNIMYQIGLEVIVVLLIVEMLKLLIPILLYQFNSNQIFILLFPILMVAVILLNGKFQMMLVNSPTIFQETEEKIINGI
jgi:hypothetical protein